MAKTSADEKFENQDFDLFDAIAAIDKKDYGYYSRLTPEQQKKFVPFMMAHWISSIKSNNSDLARYYVMSVNENVNTHLFNENVQKHPELMWLMLCSASPGIGKQFHQWIPHIKERVAKLKEHAKLKDMKDYYKKIYPNANDDSITEISEAFIEQNAKKMFLAEEFPTLKFEDIEVLSGIISAEEIESYRRDSGN
jgi:hypothetical protein